MPLASIRTRTWPGPGSSSWSSSMATGSPGRGRTAARIGSSVRVGSAPLSDDRPTACRWLRRPRSSGGSTVGSVDGKSVYNRGEERHDCSDAGTPGAEPDRLRLEGQGPGRCRPGRDAGHRPDAGQPDRRAGERHGPVRSGDRHPVGRPRRPEPVPPDDRPRRPVSGRPRRPEQRDPQPRCPVPGWRRRPEPADSVRAAYLVSPGDPAAAADHGAAPPAAQLAGTASTRSRRPTSGWSDAHRARPGTSRHEPRSSTGAQSIRGPRRPIAPTPDPAARTPRSRASGASTLADSGGCRRDRGRPGPGTGRRHGDDPPVQLNIPGSHA